MNKYKKGTQKWLIWEYLKENGSILPAKMIGKEYKDLMFGSDCTTRCRNMRQDGDLRSERDKDNPKFERFYPTKEIKKIALYALIDGEKKLVGTKYE